jgi:hypothetical protein
MENWENNAQPDWIAEPDGDDQAVVNSEFQQLLALNQELCATNGVLYAQVGQLKDELTGAEKILQWQKTRSSVTESMLSEQTQELTAAQEQIQSLSRQLEAALQTVQHQETFLENHKSQLQISQQRLAQLERECSLLQGNYSEQSQQLLQSENTCRELRSRLMRQQRQTLQFKVALEKCLDTPIPNYDTLEETSHPSQDINCGQTRFSRKARSLFPNAQPIKPWSAESELGNHASNSWVESILPPLYNDGDRAEQVSISSETGAPESDDLPNPVETIPSLTPTVDETVNHPSESVSSSSGNSWDLDQHLENLIQMFFAAQDGSGTPQNPPPTADQDGSEGADAPVWGILTSILESEQKITQQASNLPTDESPIDSISAHRGVNIANSEDYWAEVSSTTVVKLPEQGADSAPLKEYPRENKSPSPLIYPQRPPKGRKSLAAVELPNFRPMRAKSGGSAGEKS